MSVQKVLAQARHACTKQADFVALICRRLDLFVPMLSIWVASLGGGEHMPVTTYYLVEVGATTAQLGNFGVIRTVGSLALSPVYGWLLDRRSAYLPIVFSASCCAFGCLLRGLVPVGDIMSLYAANVVLGLGAANFFNVVGAYVALATPRDHRDVAVSGYQVQISALNLLGIAIYPGCDWLLIWAGLGERLIRYRIHMSACSVFCVFGFVYMLVRFRPVSRASVGDEAREAEKCDGPVDKLQLGLLLGALVVQAFGETVVTVLWPLHIRKMGWGSHEYAYLDIAAKLLIIVGTMAYPALARFLGCRRTASLLPAMACFTSAVAFLQEAESTYGQAMHVIHALAFLSACGVMKVCFQHLTTLAVPPSMQGRVFSLLAMLASGGQVAGNLFGTRLVDHETAYTSKGATPFLLASTLFALAGCGVAGLLVVPHHCPSTRGGAPPEEATKCAAALPEPHMEEVGLQM